MTHSTRPSGARLGRTVGISLSAALLLALLPGCTAIMNTLHKVHEESFDSSADAATGWVGTDYPGWIPDDSADIHNMATMDETSSVIVVGTDADPVGCTEGDRHSIPFESPDWAPTIDAFPATAWICGDYEVMPIEGGLMGWFSATETGQTPGS